MGLSWSKTGTKRKTKPNNKKQPNKPNTKPPTNIKDRALEQDHHFNSKSEEPVALLVACTPQWDIANYNPTTAKSVENNNKWNIFLSHKQSNGGAQCHALFQNLTHAHAAKVWYDNNADRLNAAGMEEGVRRAEYFVIYVTDGMFDSEWCRKEIAWAIEYDKPIIVVYESDPRHGGKSFADFIQDVPEGIRELLLNDEWIEFHTRKELFNGVVNMLLERCNIKPTPTETRDIFADASRTSAIIPKRLSTDYQPGTRQWLFDAVHDWQASAKGNKWSQVFVLTGLAGVGKSVFASQVCVRGSLDFPESNQEGNPPVAAFHFFKHDSASDCQARTALISITSQLRRSVPGFADALLTMNIDEAGLRDTWSLAQVFENLISKPSRLVKHSHPVIVVIDALDECSQAAAFYQLLRQSWIKDVANWLGLFITSRPEYQGNWPSTASQINTEDHRNTDDIASFLRVKLKDDAATHEHLESMVAKLLDLSGGLFLYMRFLDDLLQEARELKQAKNDRTSASSSKSLSRKNNKTNNTDDVKLTPADLVDLPQGMGGVFAEYFGRLFDKLNWRERMETLEQQTKLEKLEMIELKDLHELAIAEKLDDNLYQNVLAPVADAREPLPLVLWMRCFGLDTYRGTDALTDKKAAVEFDKIRLQCRNLLMETTDLETGTITVQFVHKSMSDWLTGGASDDHDSAFKIGCKHLCASLYAEGHRVLNKQITKLSTNDREGVNAMMDTALNFAGRHRFYHLCKVEKFDDAAEIVFNLDKLMEWIQVSGSGVLVVLKDIEEQLVRNQVAKGSNERLVRQARIVANVLRLGSNALLEDIRQLPSQIVGRLSVSDVDGKGMESVKQLREQAWNYKPQSLEQGGQVRWLRPFKPCLDSALPSALIRVIHRQNSLGSGVTTVVFSPDGKSIASGSWDKAIRLLDAETGEDMFGAAAFKGHTEGVNSVSFSRDGKTIASGSKDKTIRLWDVDTGEATLGGVVLKGHTAEVTSVVFSSNGNTIVSGSKDKTIRLWNAETGEARLVLQGHTGGVNTVSVSPDGNTIASGSDDMTICLWDAETGELLLGGIRGHTDTVNSLAFSPDGNTIASGSDDKTIRLWNVKTGVAKLGDKTLEGHTAAVKSVVFSPDGNTIASGSDDNTVRLWDTAAEFDLGSNVVLKGHHLCVVSVAFSPNGKTIVSGSWDMYIRLWDCAETHETKRAGKATKGHSGMVYSMSFSADGKTIASGSADKTIRLWDAETGEAKLAGKALEGHTKEINTVPFSPDCKTIATGSYDKTIRLWDVQTGEAKLGGKPLEGHTGGVYTVAYSPDGKTIASGSGDCTIRFWDVDTGKPKLNGKVLKGHTDGVVSVAFSPDGKTLASGSQDSTIRFWDVDTGEVKLGGMALKGHTGWVMSVSFSPNGKTIVSGSREKSGGKSLEGRTRRGRAVAFSRDGKTIVSGSGGEDIRMWDVQSGQEVIQIQGTTLLSIGGMSQGRANAPNLVRFSLATDRFMICAPYCDEEAWRVGVVLSDTKTLAVLHAV